MSNKKNTFYSKAQSYVRRDVVNYYDKPNLLHSGFKIEVKLPGNLSGEYILGMVYEKDGKFHKYAKFNMPICIVQ